MPLLHTLKKHGIFRSKKIGGTEPEEETSPQRSAILRDNSPSLLLNEFQQVKHYASPQLEQHDASVPSKLKYRSLNDCMKCLENHCMLEAVLDYSYSEVQKERSLTLCSTETNFSVIDDSSEQASLYRPRAATFIFEKENNSTEWNQYCDEQKSRHRAKVGINFEDGKETEKPTKRTIAGSDIQLQITQ